MSDERRLSESEVDAVLRRAADDTASGGLTVAQVRSIAEDVGLSPEAVQRALAASAGGLLRPATVQRQFGVPVAVAKEVTLPGALSESSWAVFVSACRSTFSARGQERVEGGVRVWRNGHLRIALEPTPDGPRLRFSTRRIVAPQSLTLGGLGALMSATMLAAGASGRPALMAAAVVPALMSVGAFVWPFLRQPAWVREREAQFDALAQEATSLAASAAGVRAADERPLLPTADDLPRLSS